MRTRRDEPSGRPPPRRSSNDGIPDGRRGREVEGDGCVPDGGAIDEGPARRVKDGIAV